MMSRTVAIMVIAISLMYGCKGETEVKDIEGWIKAGNFSKVNEYVSNTNNPMEKRVSAMLILVEYGQITAVQHALEDVKDRKEFVTEVVKSFETTMVEGSEELQVYAKDALFALMRYLEDKDQGATLKRIADWGLKGLTDKLSKDELIEILQRRGMVGTLTELKDYGIPVAALLISHGIDTQRLSRYVSETQDRKLQILVLNSVRKLFAMKNLVIPWSVLDSVRRFRLPETVDFMVDVYMNENFPGSVRESALAVAQALIDDSTEKKNDGTKDKDNLLNTAEKRKLIMSALKKLMKSTEGTDRWDSSEQMLAVGGIEELPTVLDNLTDSAETYFRYVDDNRESPGVVIVELCANQLKKKRDVVQPALEAKLTNGDRVQKAFAILCLKVLANPTSIAKLKPLVKDATSLENFFYDGRDLSKRKAAIASKSIPELTIGTLARNAINGIKLLGELDNPKTAKKMGKKEIELRKLSAISVINVSGKAYNPAVEQHYRKAKQQNDEESGSTAKDSK